MIRGFLAFAKRLGVKPSTLRSKLGDKLEPSRRTIENGRAVNHYTDGQIDDARKILKLNPLLPRGRKPGSKNKKKKRRLKPNE